MMKLILLAGMLVGLYDDQEQPLVLKNRPKEFNLSSTKRTFNVGDVRRKVIRKGVHFISAHAYGMFIVSEEEFETIELGEPIPSWLIERRQGK